MSPTITKVEILALLANLPDDTPLTAYDLSRQVAMNLELTESDVAYQLEEDWVAIQLEATDTVYGVVNNTITVGQLRSSLQEAASDMPLIAYSQKTEGYRNLELTLAGLAEILDGLTDTVALTAHDNYDTRQW